MSTQTMASYRAYQLSDAVADMAQRLMGSERQRAYAALDFARDASKENRALRDRADRACGRQFKALMRLTAALRDLPMKEEK